MPSLIQSRFISSFFGSIFRGVISFVTGMLLARWLGVEDFGRLAFLLGSFSALRGLLDMGTSTAFFTFLSQRTRSRAFIGKFWIWVAFQLFISMCMVCILLPDQLLEQLWKSKDRSILALALLATFMQGSVWNIASQMAEASRNTIRLQKLNTTIVAIHLLMMTLLWMYGQLVIPLIFVVTGIEWGVASWLASQMYVTQGVNMGSNGAQDDTALNVFKEFWIFCSPLIFYTWLSFVYEFADRWMLQTWGGNSQQAYFSVAQQFSGVALIATTSILRIFWKEAAEGHHAGRGSEIVVLYTKISKILYFIGAMIAGALLPWADEILRITVGEGYIAGASTLMLLLLYPVHQSLGQISGTLAYATENVRVQVRLGILFMALSLVITYFVLAPNSALLPGLGLGSEGLALKMVAVQMLSVNILGWYLSKNLNMKFEWSYQIVVLGACIFIGWISFKLVSILFFEIFSTLVIMVLSLPIFFLLISIYLYVFPVTAGITRQEIHAFLKKLKPAVVGKR